ncbi:hypothetical protein ACHAWT_003113 [Skeletonema menzelii]
MSLSMMATSLRGTQKSADPPGTPPISRSTTLCAVDERADRKLPLAFNRTLPPVAPRVLFTTPVSSSDPLGTPPTSSSIMSTDETFDRPMSADKPFNKPLPFNGSASPKKVPPAFNRTYPPPPVAPRTLFPSVSSSDRNNHEGQHKSPPSVRRKGQEKPVFLWELEDEDDIPSHSDSSGENLAISHMAMLSGDVPTPHRKRSSLSERGADVASDPGHHHSRVQTYSNIATKEGKSVSDAAGPTSPPSLSSRWKNGSHASPSKRGGSTTKEQPRGDIPQSPDEHAARLKEIMNKREKKKKGKKTKRQSDTASSDVSGASSSSRRSSSVSNYADDPINYLNEKLTEKEKISFRLDDANSAVGSKDSKGSTVSSLGSKSSANASNGKWRDAKIEKKYPTVIDADKRSDVSSEISGASNGSSIFAATRAKLKGYLKSYKKSDKKKSQKDSNKSTKPAAPQLSPARESPPGPERNLGTPSTLFSIEESDADSPLRTVRSNNAPNTPASRYRKSFEEKISHLSTPPSSSFPEIILPHIHESDERNEAVEGDTTTKVLDLPWRYDGKDGELDDKPTTERKHVGLYSGPVNELLQPHGKGKLVLKANSSEIFYGTWEDGKLISPLTDEKEPVTDDEDDISAVSNESEEEPIQAKISAALNNSAPPAASIKYAINRHRNYNRLSMENIIERESAALGRVRAKKLRKPKPKPIARYNIGDACRTPQDMIICRSKEEATESAGLLKKWDGAFVKRSCGVWTYAVLIERALQPMDVIKRRLEYFYWTSVWEVDPRYEMEDSMLFAIDVDGSTKIIPKHAWAKYVRRIQCNNTIPNIPGRVSNPAPTKNDPTVPTQIAFDTDGPEPNGLLEPSGQDGDDLDEKAQIFYPC